MALATLTTNGQQPARSQPPTPTELRAILENQPDFTADGISSDLEGTREVNKGRVARRGNLYRIDPGPGILRRSEESGFEHLRPGTYGIVDFEPVLEKFTALIVQTKEHRYYQISANDDDDIMMEAYALMVVHPHILFLNSAVADRKKPALEYLGEAKVDGHPCVKFAESSEWGSGRTVYFAARDLKNLVVRIEWTIPSTGSLIELFPLEGVTFLRNVKLKAPAGLFAVPRGFSKADRAAELADKEALRQKRLRSARGAPRVSGVTVEPPVVRPGKTANISVGCILASDEIKLSFMWKPEAGRIVGTGPQVEFDATGLAEGEYGVTFEVTDNYGHAPYVGRVMLKVREVEHDLSGLQTPFPSAGFEQVFCAVEDRAGGWFLAGKLMSNAGPDKHNVVHLLANGALDPSFAADTGLSVVEGLAVGDVALYAVGAPNEGSGVVALDLKTGARLKWDPRVNGFARTIAVAGKTLYVGGILESVGGELRQNLAAIDAVTAKVLPWNPAPNGPVRKLVVADNRLFVAGLFESIAGKRQSSMVIFDVSSGSLIDFEVTMFPDPSSISVSGNIVYFVAGSQVGAIDITTGRHLGWNPTIDGEGWAIAARGDTVYVVGSFTTVEGKTRPRIAAIDAKTGSATNWDPEADSHSWVIIPSGDRVFVGGNFETIGRQRRSKFAVLDAKTGEALPGAVK